MMVPPLSERPVTEEDEEQFRRESAPRRYTLWERWSDYRADVKRNRPKGAKARFRAWMDADAVDWGIRVAIVFLFIGGSLSLIHIFARRLRLRDCGVRRGHARHLFRQSRIRWTSTRPSR